MAGAFDGLTEGFLNGVSDSLADWQRPIFEANRNDVGLFLEAGRSDFESLFQDSSLEAIRGSLEEAIDEMREELLRDAGVAAFTGDIGGVFRALFDIFRLNKREDDLRGSGRRGGGRRGFFD